MASPFAVAPAAALRPSAGRTARPGPLRWRARAAYISYFPDLAFPGAVEAVGALAEAARAAGVERLVLLSGRSEHHAQQGEEAVLAAGVPTIRLRCAWFAQNFSEGYLRDPILSGALLMPGGDVAEPILDVDDIAEVAVKALKYNETENQFYELTGPRLMTFAGMAATLSQAAGVPVRFVPISFEQFHAGLAEGAGTYVADVFTAIARETLDGRNAVICDGVERALGLPPPDPKRRGLIGPRRMDSLPSSSLRPRSSMSTVRVRPDRL